MVHVYIYISLCAVLSVSVYACKSLQYGQTPLMKTSQGGHVGCVQLLLDRGAQANRRDKVSAVGDETSVCMSCITQHYIHAVLAL